METKICGKCKQEKPISEFYKSKRDGYRSRCKTCHKEDCQEYAKTGYYREYSKKYPKARVAQMKYRTTLKGRIHGLRFRAKRRGVPFNLTPSEFMSLDSATHCYYCGVKFTDIKKRPLYSKTFDRLDNNGGYVLGNVVMACMFCNTLKSELLTGDEMLIVGEIFRKARLRNSHWREYGEETLAEAIKEAQE